MTSRKELLDREYATAPEQLSTETIDSTKDNSIEQLTIDKTSRVDYALEQTADLISAPKFKPWYAQQAYRLGVDRYMGIASDARRGNQPARLFSFMLKRA